MRQAKRCSQINHWRTRTAGACLRSSSHGACSPHKPSTASKLAFLTWQRRSSARPMCAHRALPQQASPELCHLGAATAVGVTRWAWQLQCALTRSTSMSTTSLVCSCKSDTGNDHAHLAISPVHRMGMPVSMAPHMIQSPFALAATQWMKHGAMACLICPAPHLQPVDSTSFVRMPPTCCTDSALAAARPCR